jgi:uncharacterized membrane protein
MFTLSHGIMAALLLIFALAHSGLAALRPWGESKIGARAYRVLFALVSIPLATVLIVYFIDHRYDGWHFWNLQGVPGVKAVVWGLSALSFFFLYPATFNLLEIAALQKPQIHLYETGIIRICRHPQLVGQIIWCFAHSLWLGTSFTLLTSLGLIAHHSFAVWHGDRRWLSKYGDAFLQLQQRTAIIPFQALWQGKQTLRLEEFLKPAYGGVIVFIFLLWWSHPWLIQIGHHIPRSFL